MAILSYVESRHLNFLFSLLTAYLWGTSFVYAQSDKFELNPLTNFCSRWWSQSVVKNDVLYIDSGVQKYNGTDISAPIFGINNYLLTIPLNTTWDWKKDIVINAEPKNETNPATGTLPPSLIRGHIFHGPLENPDIYVYGGTTYMGNQTFEGYNSPDSAIYSLWSYTPDTLQYPWRQYDIVQPWMANHGAATEAIDQGLGFYLNGQIDWGTSAKTSNNIKSEDLYRPLDGMLVIDFGNYTSNNISTASIRSNAPRVGGSMEYFAPVGGMGILVALGGQIQPGQTQPYSNISQGELLDFSSVDIFDIDSYLQNLVSNGTWYQQNTTGEIPPARIDFCTVSISSADKSSHHIYLYGGRDPTKKLHYDDVYVLTLPSFTWTPIFTSGSSPRWGHNCHIAGMRQMITVGGNITNTGKCDWERKGVAVLEMSTVTWGSVFQTNLTTFEVPQRVLSATGGTASGAATMKEPTTGWTDQRLKTVFDTPRKWTSNPETSSPPEPGSTDTKKNVGTIAGGVVGGVLAFALILSALLAWRLKRAQARGPHELASDEMRPEIDGDKRKYELQGLNGNDPVELPGFEPPELHTPQQLFEADRDTATRAAELPGTNTVAGGVHGVPIVRTPGDDLPTPPLYTAGLSSGGNSATSDAEADAASPGETQKPVKDYTWI
ncbi:hypothetical protein BDV95DRAFT_337793 [Massariosphaeria phaeospora]|uniref:Kelch repeat protein-like protein n=1 Tax=Massariosphaeria phaeospora TaxID=100035 RepID=A0A7C8IAE3_9PLEO|nr:hypothetical protein BDV95DRAFT_337793 [Massariosphaeria phaeospora]